MNSAMMMLCVTGALTAGQPDVVFKAPLIQVRQERRDGKDFHYLMYNGIYLGRNYHKPRNPADHGDFNRDFSRTPTTYYHDKSPVGVVMQKYNWFHSKDNTYHADVRAPASLIGLAGLDPCGQLGQLAHLWSEPPVAVLGLEIGTVAAYARPTQTFHCTERVPTFVKLSIPDKGDKRYFHYVQDALDRGANLKILPGEPRDEFAKHGGDNFYQVIFVETFNVPDAGLHKELLTKEALQLLMSKVREDGIVCFHTSNRHYNLVPIIASAAKDLKLAMIVGKDMGDFRGTPGDDYRFISEWIMIARLPKHLAHLKSRPDNDVEWYQPEIIHKKLVWTDKGEQSLRGCYYSNPDIDKFQEAIYAVHDLLRDKTKLSDRELYEYSRPFYAVIRAASQMSANSLNRGAPAFPRRLADGRTIVFVAPRLRVTQDRAGTMDSRYLMYNGVYFGRNYLKPKDESAYGDPDKDASRFATTYFHDRSPVGMALQPYNWFPGKVNTYDADARLPVGLVGMGGDCLNQLGHLWSEPPIAVVGLDVGTVASYARPAQTMHFFERVPEFVKFSLPNDGERPTFRYVGDALQRGANLKVFEGEPRPTIEKHAGEKFYQLIIFSTCNRPIVTVHKELMTKEGLQLLMSKTRDDGILCLHVSNRYYDLVPIVASTAKDLGYAVLVGEDFARWKDDVRDDRFNSSWVMVARKTEHLKGLKAPKGYDNADRWMPGPFWREAEFTHKDYVWTDKGENSFRGVYSADPAIMEFSRWLSEVDRGFADDGLEMIRIPRAVYGALNLWSRSSTARLNRELSPKDKN